MQNNMAAIDYELLEALEEAEEELQEDGEDDGGEEPEDRGDDPTGVDGATLSELADGDEGEGEGEGEGDGEGEGEGDDQQQRSSHIPRDRFDTVNERAKAYAAMLRSQGIDPDTGERMQPAGTEGDSTGAGPAPALTTSPLTSRRNARKQPKH